MIVIGVSGKKGSGKDTFFHMLEKNSKIPVYRLALADTLKNEIYERILKPDGLERQLLDNVETKENFRTLLQWWGTEYRRRMFQDEYWLVKLAEQIKQYDGQNVIVVVTDVRFQNEFKFLKEMNGLMVRIARPNTDACADEHPSETALDNETNFDTFVDNNGSLEQFEQLVQTYIYSLESRTPCTKLVSVVR